MSLKSTFKKLVRKAGGVFGLNVVKKAIRRNPEIAKIAGGVVSVIPGGQLAGAALITAASASELAGKTKAQQDASAFGIEPPELLRPPQAELMPAASSIQPIFDRSTSLAGSFEAGQPLQSRTVSRAGRAAPARRKRKTVKKSKRRSTSKKRKTKLKFGSPAWRKKYLKRKR